MSSGQRNFCFLKILLALLLLTLSSPVLGQDLIPGQEASQTVIEGTLTLLSKLPSAKDNPYPDCNYTALVKVARIMSGQSVPRMAVLVLPGFFKREYAPEAYLKAGDKVRATIVPFASTSDKVKQTQQADDVENIDLPLYYACRISSIQEFEKAAKPHPFATNEPAKTEMANHRRIDDKAREIRKRVMQRDLEAISELLINHGGDWNVWNDSLKEFRNEYQKQYDAKAQKWVGNSFFSAGRFDNGKIYSPGFVKSIIALKDYLAARDIDLIVIRVPNKGEIVDDLFAPVPADKVTNPYLLKLYKELLEADVEVVPDIIPKAKDARSRYPLMFWYQDFDEFHPGEGIAWVVAQAFSERVQRYDLKPTNKFSLTNQLHHKYQWPKGNENQKATDPVTFAGVRYSTTGGVNITHGNSSPVLLIGSSIMDFPDFQAGGSIAHYFTYLSGITPDQLSRAGGDAMMLRYIAREGEIFLFNRVVCLFPIFADSLYVPLKALPTIDTDRSKKKLIKSYSKRSLADVVDPTSRTPKEAVSYSKDGTLNILPLNSHKAKAELRIKVPESVVNYPFFTMEIEFFSRDISNIKVTYANNSDTVIRVDTRPESAENFTFETGPEEWVTLEIATEMIDAPTRIRKISFFGITEPSFYK